MKTIPARLTLVWASLIIIILMLPGQSSTAVTLNDAAGIWLFDEDQIDVAADSSENRNDGEINGAKSIEGKFGAALEFNGVDSYIKTSFQAIEAEEGTIMAWIKTYGPPKTCQIILYTSKGGGDGYGGDEEFHVDLRDNGTFNFFSASGGFDLNLGPYEVDRWYHIATTWKSDNLARLYLDGEQLGESNMGKPDSSGWMDYVYIGRPSANKRFFHGIIDEVAIFNVALTKDDIGSIMTEGLSKSFSIKAVLPTEKLTTTWATLRITK